MQPALHNAARADGVGIDAVAAGPPAWHRRSYGRPVPRAELQAFSEHVAAYLGAGIPAVDALEMAADANVSRPMREVIEAVRTAVVRGASFADAVAAHPRVFPASYIAMVRAAEQTGRLDQTLDRLAAYIERDLAARRQVTGALAYPLVVLGLAAVALVVISTVVLPRFGRMYDALGADLPLPTAVLLGATGFVGTHLVGIMVAVAAVTATMALVLGGTGGRRRRQRLVLRLPVVGRIARLVALERFCRVLAALATTGVALPEALGMAASSTGSHQFEVSMRDVTVAILRGGDLSTALGESGLLPDAARRMVMVGERTGTLPAQLAKAAAYYEREVTTVISRAIAVFQPAVMVAVGVVVGFVAVAQVAAMYSVYGRLEL